jgi:hypothetical protein
LLFDRSYELWSQYDTDGEPKQPIGPDNNNPAVIGCLADIRQMQQFTGMTVGYSTDSGNTVANSKVAGHQGVLQLIPSYVFFGLKDQKRGLWFYGYVSEWDFTITHWTQYMVPMRCVIDITFTMLPTPNTIGTASNSNTNWSVKNIAGSPF